MSVLNAFTFVICMVTLAICVAAARRVRWRAGVLYLLVGVVPLAQLGRLVSEILGWEFNIPSLLRDLAECGVSLIFLLAMFLVRQDAVRQSQAEARLRLSEALVGSELGPVEKQLETDLRLSQLSQVLSRKAPSSGSSSAAAREN